MGEVVELKFGERRRLPDRRPSISKKLTFVGSNGAEHEYEATIGFYPDPKIFADIRIEGPNGPGKFIRYGTPNDPGEIFLFGAKDGTDLSALCADGSVLISIALQYGAPPEVLAEAIGRTPVELDGPPVQPVSILGAALDAILAAKREGQEPDDG